MIVHRATIREGFEDVTDQPVINIHPFYCFVAKDLKGEDRKPVPEAIHEGDQEALDFRDWWLSQTTKDSIDFRDWWLSQTTKDSIEYCGYDYDLKNFTSGWFSKPASDAQEGTLK